MESAIAMYAVCFLNFVSDRTYDNPLWDAELTIELASPNGRKVIYDGYWDDGHDWKAAVSLDEIGTWTWRSTCTDTANAGLHGRTGTLVCVKYEGDNPLYKHGPLRVAGDGFHFEHADGEPFFWLGDTAWNGVIRGDDANWAKYLDARAAQKFTVIMFVAPHWRGDEKDEAGRTACTEEHPIRIHPDYFQDKDRRVAMINERGMIAAPVALWTLLKSDLGYKLPEEDCIKLARYIHARYGAYQVAWLLGGDGNYQEMGFDKWKHIGRAVFANPRGRGHDRLVTLHPCGQAWPNEAYRDETWFDFMGYQSGHGDADDHVKWLVDGPPGKYWNRTPHKPIINLEPNYEAHPSYHHKQGFTDYHVRRAAYWSLLVTPPAGLTYGHHAIWNWNFTTGSSEGHAGLTNVQPWHTGIDTPGVRNMTVMRDFFEAMPWTTLRPAPRLIADQPGEKNPNHFIAAAQSLDGKLAVIYTPTGGEIKLTDKSFTSAQWFNPRTGERTDAPNFTAPDLSDWLLVLRKQ